MSVRPAGDSAALAACAVELRHLVAALRQAAEQVRAPAANSGLIGPAGVRIQTVGEHVRQQLNGQAEHVELLSHDAVRAAERVADAQRDWDHREVTLRREAEARKSCE